MDSIGKIRELEDIYLKAHGKERLYPVYCAWCQGYEGKNTVIRYKNVEGSHGICKKCQIKYMGGEK